VYTWLGLLAPLNLPQPIVAKLAKEVTRIMRAPDMEKRVASDGYLLVLNTPAEFRNEIQTEVAAWLRVIRERGVKAD
jgi:tripartite-type tricarboxylate transporter receptor subunit TctC